MQPGAKVRWETGPMADWMVVPTDPEKAREKAKRLLDVDALVHESVGRVELVGRGETMPLFKESA